MKYMLKKIRGNIIGERERANLVVSTADFSLYIFIYIYIYIYIYLYISGAGRHHTVMFYVILNTRTNVKFQKCSTKLHVFEARLFVMDAAQHSSHIVLCAAKNFPRKLVNGN